MSRRSWQLCVGPVLTVVTLLSSMPSASAAHNPIAGTYYVALGDSYTSGEGLPPFIASAGSCDQSPFSFPEVVKKALKFTKFTFVACSGATIAQVDQQVGRVPPSIFKRTSLATVTAGGNDLPFSGLLSACLGASTSPQSPSFAYLTGFNSQASCDAAIASAAALLGTSYDPTTRIMSAPSSALASPLTLPSTIELRLTALYLHILHDEGAKKGARTGPKLIVVQYPSAPDNLGAGNCVVAATTFNLPQYPVLNSFYPAYDNLGEGALSLMNTYLQDEIAAAIGNLRSRGYLGISLARTQNMSAPLDCQTGLSTDMNGLLFVNTATQTTKGSFHPTASGQNKAGAAVVATWRRLPH